MARFEIRAATRSDLPALLELARHLDTVNLPHDRAHLEQLLAHAEASFAEAVPESHRRLVFVLHDRELDRAVGTSQILGQLGRRDAPYIYLDVLGEEKYSRTLDRLFRHTVLRLRFSYDGPTEIGGLVVLPEHRRGKDKLGLSISWVRFLFIALHRPWFRDELLAELLPPLLPDGTSHLWEALGRHFTGMSYAEADRLSAVDKDFVRELFPGEVIYASLLSPEAQAVLGAVGPDTAPVERMLRRIGFRYAERVDPFDGGPHFLAPTDQVAAVAGVRRAVHMGPAPPDAHQEHCLVTPTGAPATAFRAAPMDVAWSPAGGVYLAPVDAAALGLALGDGVAVLSLE